MKDTSMQDEEHDDYIARFYLG
jgi:hypothetical protein